MQRTWINELTDQTNVGLGGTHGSATQLYDVSLGNNGIIPLIGVQGEDGTTFANYLSMNPYVKKNLIQTRNFQFSDASGCYLLQFLWLIIYKEVILSPEILFFQSPFQAESINFIFAAGKN